MSAEGNFRFLDDPSVKIRYRKRAEEEGFKLESLMDDDTGQDSILQKYGFIFERVWYIGHISVMTLTLLSILMCLTRQVLKPWPRLLYRFTFVCAVFTYSLSLFQNLNGAEPGFYAMLPLGTFQYLCLAFVWIFTTPHTIKLIPYALYSLLHVADTASEHHNTSKSRSRIAHGLSDDLAPRVLDLLGYLDLWLLVELLMDAILVRRGAVVALFTFGFVYNVKLMFNPSTWDAFYDCYQRVDKVLSSHDRPEKVRELWIRLRNRFEEKRMQTSGLHARERNTAIEYRNLMGK